MIIHPHLPKKKKRKPNAYQRALALSWEEILKKYEVKPQSKSVSTGVRPVRILRDGCDTSHIPSLDSGLGNTSKASSMVYTGDAMIGIGQLHKSNAIPVFSQEEAIDISKMRRG